jgi:predicted dehydrogenase
VSASEQTGPGRPGLSVAVLGCGLIGHKRSAALGSADTLVGAYDVVAERATELTSSFGGRACASVEDLFGLVPDVVIVAVIHDQLASLTEQSLDAGAHVLVEKPAGISRAEIARLQRAQAATGKVVKVGFNHRFHPALADLAAEVHSGEHGELMHVRARYGHGGRPGYDREWRAQVKHSGGGELVDQGMHLLDLTHWLAGPLPLHSALLRTQFWDTEVEDNAALLLGAPDERGAPWAMLHATWTEWKNMFSLEAYCRSAKLEVDGLVRSYGQQRLLIYRMGPDLGPPACEERTYGTEDRSWSGEWEHFACAIATGEPVLGGLADAHYAWSRVEDAYALSPPYAPMRGALTPEG